MASRALAVCLALSGCFESFYPRAEGGPVDAGVEATDGTDVSNVIDFCDPYARTTRMCPPSISRWQWYQGYYWVDAVDETATQIEACWCGLLCLEGTFCPDFPGTTIPTECIEYQPAGGDRIGGCVLTCESDADCPESGRCLDWRSETPDVNGEVHRICAVSAPR